jgi:hypothetical protein
MWSPFPSYYTLLIQDLPGGASVHPLEKYRSFDEARVEGVDHR